MKSEDDEVKLPLFHPALKRHWLFSEFGLTDADLEKMHAKTINYEVIINNAVAKALKLKRKLKNEEARKGIGLK